jgi:hypothetical protein
VGNNASDQTFEVWNAGTGTLEYEISDNQNWLTVSPTFGTSSGGHNIHTVNYSTSGMILGSYNATITVTDPDSDNNPQTITVNLNVGDAPAFTAYNDLSWDSGQTSTNITRYTSDDGTGTPPDGNSGELKDYATGDSIPGGIVSVAGGTWIGPTHAAQGAEPAEDSPGNLVFDGIISCKGVISYGTTNVTLVFSGLDSAQLYTLVLFCNRDRYSGERWSNFIISGVDSFVNESSAGATISQTAMADDTTQISAYNTVDGYIAKYANIDSGADGTFMVTVDGENPYINAFMLQAQAFGSTPVDDDGDGMPDGWEAAHFGDTSRTGDGDEDGDNSSNLDEYVAGTVPTNNQSVFKIYSAEYPASTFTLRWHSVAGRTYAIKKATDLNAGFTPVASGIAATPGTNEQTMSLGEGACFLKIVVE